MPYCGRSEGAKNSPWTSSPSASPMAAGAAPSDIKRGVEAAVATVSQRLLDNARPVEGKDVAHVAAISAQSEEIGELIARAFETVGTDGVITIEDMAMFGHLRPKPDARMFRALAARL